ncbi:DUF2920 family protein [Gracilibacillus timonensis]|uniref:DUF2920 family protein n=1 Tax=Gracilibacillus timonensis TaxID=1816696 RepID=UPI0008268885|nr:DUF2920 family protein [Gracilibacillus timonensis]
MTFDYNITIPAHYNIYTGNYKRELRVDFSIPENDKGEITGILLLVPGFGATIDSNVYKKMREKFSDDYNVVALQCEYFGSKYMQTAEKVMGKKDSNDKELANQEMEQASKDLKRQIPVNINGPFKAKIDETIEDFNDMGYMQAIDLVTAIEVVKTILKENQIVYNETRVIGYGHSHGAYLLHLSNRLVPNLFSYIIDNSAWIEPIYLTYNRYLNQRINNTIVNVEFDYLAKKIIKEKKNLNLNIIYKYYKPSTQIICFQGDNDLLVAYTDKEKLIATLKNAEFVLVKKENIDNEKYYSNSHGLAADFLKLFDYAMTFEQPISKVEERNVQYKVKFGSIMFEVDYSNGLPIFLCIK